LTFQQEFDPSDPVEVLNQQANDHRYSQYSQASHPDELLLRSSLPSGWGVGKGVRSFETCEVGVTLGALRPARRYPIETAYGADVHEMIMAFCTMPGTGLGKDRSLNRTSPMRHPACLDAKRLSQNPLAGRPSKTMYS